MICEGTVGGLASHALQRARTPYFPDGSLRKPVEGRTWRQPLHSLVGSVAMRDLVDVGRGVSLSFCPWLAGNETDFDCLIKYLIKSTRT